jgi:hypothetical protein
MPLNLKRTLSKSYNWLGLTSILLALVPLFKYESAFEFQLRDTYYVIGNLFIDRIIYFMLFILWLTYILTRRFPLSNVLTWIHVSVTCICSILTVTFPWWVMTAQWNLNNTVGWYDANTFELYEYRIIPVILGLMVAQFIFLINLVVGYFNRNKQKRLV